MKQLYQTRLKIALLSAPSKMLFTATVSTTLTHRSSLIARGAVGSVVSFTTVCPAVSSRLPVSTMEAEPQPPRGCDGDLPSEFHPPSITLLATVGHECWPPCQGMGESPNGRTVHRTQQKPRGNESFASPKYQKLGDLTPKSFLELLLPVGLKVSTSITSSSSSRCLLHSVITFFSQGYSVISTPLHDQEPLLLAVVNCC